MNKDEGINKIKEILKNNINCKYKLNTVRKGRPHVLTTEQCLDAIFLCSY